MEDTQTIKFEELKEEAMYCFVAPDGSPQLATLAPDYAYCVGLAQVLSMSGVCKTASQMFEEGFEILPVKVTVIQNGTAEDAFNTAKESL